MIVDRNKYKKDEGRSLTIDSEILGDQQTLEVSTIVPKNAKIDKEDKTSFEEFKAVYKGAIDNKCLETYGTCDDEKLWEDIAKEMYLASKTYIPDENKNNGDLGIKEESKRVIKHNKITESEKLNEEQIVFDKDNFNHQINTLKDIVRKAEDIEKMWEGLGYELTEQIDDEFDEDSKPTHCLRWLIANIQQIIDEDTQEGNIKLSETKGYSKQN